MQHAIAIYALSRSIFLIAGTFPHIALTLRSPAMQFDNRYRPAHVPSLTSTPSKFAIILDNQSLRNYGRCTRLWNREGLNESLGLQAMAARDKGSLAGLIVDKSMMTITQKIL